MDLPVIGSLPFQANGPLVIAACVLMLVVAVALVVLVVRQRIRLPALMEWGMGLTALGILATLEPLVTDYAGDAGAQAARALMLFGGLLLMLLSGVITYLKRKAAGEPMRRKEDSVPMPLDAPIDRSPPMRRATDRHQPPRP